MADALGLVAFLVCIFPVYWMINSSFLDRRDIRAPDPTWVPFGGGLDNYRRLFDDTGFVSALGMSLMVTIGTVVVALLFAFLAALAVSRFRFRGRRAFVVTLLVVQMIPAEGLFISQYKMLDALQLTNTVLGLTALYIAAVLPFTIWTLRGFVAGLPDRARGGRDGGRLHQGRRVLPHHLPAAGPRPGGDGRLRVHPGLERVHARPRGHDERRRSARCRCG